MVGETIGIIGAGVMGRGIAQLFLQAGHRVSLFDANEAAVEGACAFVNQMLDRQVAKQSLGAAERAAIGERLAGCSAIDQLADCSIVIEAIVENLEAKQSLFRQLEPLVDVDCILGTNTSSLLISEIAGGCERPERVVGVHFFNPVPLMKVAEIIPGTLTSAAVADRARTLVEQAGHRAVIAGDQPGFLVNHAGRALYTEGLRLIEERVATVSEVDRLVREAMGFRMGPFELLDLTGLDVSGKVMQSIYDQFQQEPRYRPSPLVPPRLGAGLFGRKTGRGFYTYVDGQKQDQEPDRSKSAPLPLGIRLVGDDRRVEVEVLCASVGCVTSGEHSAETPILLLSLWGEDVSTAASRLGLDAARCVALDPITDFERRRTLMKSPATAGETVAGVRALLESDGVAVSEIADSCGFVAQRMLAMIVNTGCEIAQRGIASPADIDDAVRIGLGYPSGPLALGDRLRPARLLRILEAMLATTGDPRYRPSHWLRRRGLLGLSLREEQAA